MSLDLLDTPLRATWDLWEDGQCLDEARSLALCDKICDAGLFFVVLGRRPLMHPAIAEVLGRLGGSGIRRTLLTGALEAEMSMLPQLSADNDLLLDLDPEASAGKLCLEQVRAAVDRLRRAGFEPGLALTPLRNHLSHIPNLLRLCREEGVARFKLPNLGIGAKSLDSCRLLAAGPADLEAFAQRMRPHLAELASGPRLEVHDLFLWEILACGGEQSRSEYGGCQAGNSLAHIDVRGHLHPCSSWPLDLGSLLEADFFDLWDSTLRHGVRAEVASMPRGCQGCRDYPQCLGGCRGLSLSLQEPSWQGRDLMCGARR